MPAAENTNESMLKINYAVWDALAQGYLHASRVDDTALKYSAIGGAVWPVIQRLGLDGGTVAAFATLLRQQVKDAVEPPTEASVLSEIFGHPVTSIDGVPVAGMKALPVHGVNDVETYHDENGIVPGGKISQLIGLQSARHLDLDPNISLGIVDETLSVSDRVSAIFSMVSTMATEVVEQSDGTAKQRVEELGGFILEALGKLEDKSIYELSPQFALIGTYCYLALMDISREMRQQTGIGDEPELGMAVAPATTGRVSTRNPNRANAPRQRTP